MPVSIRPATVDDVPLLAHMNDRLVQDQGSSNPMSVSELTHRFATWLHTGAWNVDVFLEEDTVIGYAVYQARRGYYYPDESVIFVRQFYIERTHRHRGLGTQLFHTLVHTRFPKGYAIALDVVATNPSGQHFWAKLGFAPYYTAMKRQIPTDDVQWHD